MFGLETVIVFFAAIVCGTISGIMPGVGGMAVMLMAYPFLIEMQPHNILIFYVSMVSVDQFFGGITAIVFGVPGSSSAVPSAMEGHKLFKQGRSSESIMYSAIGSWLTSVFGVILILAMIPLLFMVYKVWNSTVQMMIFGLTSIAIIWISKNKIIVSVALFIFGNLLGKVGYDTYTNSSFMTFDSALLYPGLPIMPVVTTMFVIPLLLNSLSRGAKVFEFPGVTMEGYIESFRKIKRYSTTLIRAGFLGSIGGFVPGMSYGMSSIMAYTVEKWVQIRRGSYITQKGNMPCLIASEGANNAGTFTQLVPLLFLGIPITVSEALIYNILDTRGYPVTIEWFQSTFAMIIVFFLFSATIGLFAAGRYVNFMKILNNVEIKWVYLCVVLFLFGAIYYVGNQTLAGLEHITITAMLLPIGLLLCRCDTMPLIYGFILHDKLLEVAVRMWILYT
jgi:putative tricarboxylic transport membrane protein